MKIAREPAIWLTAFATILRLIGAFWIDLSPEAQGWWNAGATALASVIVAIWVKRDGQVAAALGFLQAVLAIAVGYGADISAEQQALIMSAVGALAAAFIRTQVVAPVPATPAVNR
jgi:hypothetical protein